MAAVLNAVWAHVLPAFQGAGTSPITALTERLSHLALPLPVPGGSSLRAAAVSGKTYTFDENNLDARSASLTCGKDGVIFKLTDARDYSCGDAA